MELPTGETLWKIVAAVAGSISAALLGALGIQIKSFRKDRRSIRELRRKMAEIDKIREYTQDGRRAVEGMEDINRQMFAITRRQDHLESNQHDMQLLLREIHTNVGWLRQAEMAKQK